MLTRRAVVALAGASVLFTGGRLLGILELYLLAATAVLLVAGAVLWSRAAVLRLEAARTLHPQRVHAGSASRVELRIRNFGARRTPSLVVRDPFDGGRRQARFLLAPLDPGETARAAYRVPTDQRGLFRVGPLRVELGDAFGLAQVVLTAAPATEVTVYPRVDTVPALPMSRGDDPLAGAAQPNAFGTTGDDFYALREYQVGDDLRRVHWPSTARLGELMIRQDEMPWQSRATVLLDTRAGGHTPASFELAASAAASLLVASSGRRALVRLVTSEGVDSGLGEGHAHLEAMLEALAVAAPSRRDRLADVLRRLRRSGSGGTLAAITTRVARADLDSMARLRVRFGTVAIVLLERSAYDETAALEQDSPAVPGALLVPVTRERSFATSWTEAVASRPTMGVG